MSWIEATYLHQRASVESANASGRPLLRVRHSMQRESCWEPKEKVDMIDTCFQGWACPPIYVIPRTDLVDEVEDGEDLVFDGAHKLEAVFQFIENKFPLRATQFACREVKENDGKYFRELGNDLKNKVRQYKFCVNTVDEETANDPDRLRVLWERLNKAGRKLNSYELSIPIIEPLIKAVLNPAEVEFDKSILFPQGAGGRSTDRGSRKQTLQLLLALIDMPDQNFSAQSALVAAWHKKELGETMAERAASVLKKADRWVAALERCRKIEEELDQLMVFRGEDGELDLEEGIRKTELPFVIGRIARRFTRIEDFRSQKHAFAARLREEIFSKKPADMLAKLGGAGRNGTYQKKLLRFIDRIVDDVAGIVQPRLFTRKQKEAALVRQGGKCTLCSKRIFKNQLTEGDHVTEWSEGGETSEENLQMVHRHCHQMKSSFVKSAVAAAAAVPEGEEQVEPIDHI